MRIFGVPLARPRRVPAPHRPRLALTALIRSDTAHVQGLIAPMPAEVEHSRWWRRLSPPWRALLRRGADGRPCPEGRIWGAPYRVGCVLFAYKREHLKRKGIQVNDWCGREAGATGEGGMPWFAG